VTDQVSFRVPNGAQREWFFYEGLKKLTQVRRDEEVVSKMKQELYVDYADLKKQWHELPTHLPQEVMQGLEHAKLNDEAISIVADKTQLDQVLAGDLGALKAPSETESERAAREKFEFEAKKEEQRLMQQERARQLRISRQFVETKKKWEENVVKKIDLLPPDPEIHFNGRTVKPGFQFWLSLCSAPKQMLAKLDINVVDMIYVNYDAFLISTDLEK